MIQETRSKLAREQVSEFIDKMKELGFSKEEVVELLEKMGGEDA